MHTRLGRALVAVMAILVVILAGCGGGSPGESAPTDARQGFTLPDPADFSGLDRVEAFKQAHRKLSTEYALTEWKSVDWDKLYAQFLPKIEQAAAAEDPRAYYLALHQYLFGVDDGHISIPKGDANAALIDAIIAQQSGGGYGVGLATLDDGAVIAAKVAGDGPGAAAAIEAGAQILTWGGQPTAAAIDAVDLGALAAAAHMSTTEHQRLERTRLLTRAPVGTTVDVEYRNPGATTSQIVRLTAADDGLAGLSLMDFSPLPSAEDEKVIISSKTLDSGHGYIRLTALADLTNLQQYPDAIQKQFQDAIAGFANAGVPGLIIDIRGNHGGYDTLTADLCGIFAGTPSVYEATEFFDKRTGKFLSLTVNDKTGELVDALMVTPQAVRYTGPVVALVNPRTLSSGEGLAKYINDLANGAAVGFHGTRGSFALAGGEIAMPDGFAIHYPYGRSVDANGGVQIDSKGGVGGVEPKVRVPLTLANVVAYARGEDIELESAIDYLDRQAK